MDKDTFLQLLTDEVNTYKSLMETDCGDWIVKGFIDIDKNVYTITNDTKVVSKIIEIMLIPRLNDFAVRHGMSIVLPSAQNFYPDITFKDIEGNLYALDFKSSFYANGRSCGFTLGSYWGYFRQRDKKKNTDYPYNEYKCHLVLGILYKQCTETYNEKTLYSIDKLDVIKSVIRDFTFFVQPKWKIASDRPGSGNTRNIGSVFGLDNLVNGKGTFSELGEDIFDDYWINFFNTVDARNAGMEKPHYTNISTYKEYLKTQQDLLKKLE
ncbi:MULTISPECIES: type II restriction endonuclease [unclassified Prevotella]|uniref:type II restriction endonuclease n=1 Tax=unclassified Prevotella TaxID=2638335 RepID=UPI000CEA2515|nr:MULTISPECIES: type II restriction endonuclease [unclassified Prevotella]MCX4292533.1 restriction endonuclease [Prevotella sp.]NPD53632.1 restriction endonuclease [Prevotella sp. PTAC]GAY27118.1 restriction endonuclease EcoRV [Prevotella sp. MGM1]